MSWAEALLLLITFCTSGANSHLTLDKQNECRNEKLQCIKRVTRMDAELKNPVAKAEREVYLVNGCLDNSKFNPIPLPPQPKPSVTPQVSKAPNPVPSVHPSSLPKKK